MTQQQLDRRRQDADRICSAAYILVCCMNDTASSAMTDAVAQLRRTPLYRHDVKRHCNMALKAYDSYTRQLKQTLGAEGKWQFWMDFADLYQEQAAPHVLKLRLAFKQALDSERIADSALRSYILTADVLLQLAVVNFDRYFDSMKEKTGLDLRRMFQPARLDGVKREWVEVCRVMLRQPDDRDIDLNQSPRIQLAVKALDTQLMSSVFVNRAGNEALKLHTEFADIPGPEENTLNPIESYEHH